MRGFRHSSFPSLRALCIGQRAAKLHILQDTTVHYSGPTGMLWQTAPVLQHWAWRRDGIHMHPCTAAQSRTLAGVRQEIVELTEIPHVGAPSARALFNAGLRTLQAVAAVRSADVIRDILAKGTPPPSLQPSPPSVRVKG